MTEPLREYLYVLRARRLEMLTEGPTPEEADVVGRHLAHLTRLAEEGDLILAGRTLDDGASTIGIAVLRAASDEDAARIMASDPAVAEGVMDATLQPFRVAVRGR